MKEKVQQKSVRKEKVQHVFIVGAKSIGAYGGYETFVNKLAEYHRDNKKIQYHIACKANGQGSMDETKLDNVTRISNSEFIYNNARCFKIHVPDIGAAQAVYYDIKSLDECCRYIKREKIPHPVVYILACRVGPFAWYFQRKVHRLGGKIYINPDGHEWKRAKWNKAVQKYWKYSERQMVKYSDLVICDSVNIEKYIHKNYDGKGINNSSPDTTYIAYGAETRKSSIKDSDPRFIKWLESKGLTAGNYYLAVGRFVPENNYETMIREFMKSNSAHDFAIITNVNNKFLEELENKLHFKNDKRIKFAGTVYDHELLKKIRENAYGYLHGHEVGGTNPSLLEAMGSTKLNLILNVGFNREVAEKGALYWTKEKGNLAKLIDKADKIDMFQINELGKLAKKKINQNYSWELISSRYGEIFLENAIYR